MDIIQQLGSLAFASRLKRISERLMRDGSRIYKKLDFEFQARWFPVMYLLGQKSPLSVTEIARELGMTHPAINQIAAGMSKAGLISSIKDSQDERRRMLSITEKGGRIMTALVPVWKDIESATQEVLDQSGQNLLTILTRIEEALDEEDMYHRVITRMKARQLKNVEIVDYEPKWRKDFERLNVEWLEKYFTVESYDRALLSDPRRRIINKGGFILFARIDEEIVGTVAVMRHDDGSYEVAKMGVTEKAQGKQVGKRLAQAAIERATREGARSLVLYTSQKLDVANKLYRKLGFKEVDAEQPSKFERRSITMTLKLEAKNDKG
jgi:DNA-binding MarR family transcriptional regulator/N-acetylglutamate synthase-like GNAT family acetyltransferase